jgi:hypothetical protein
MTARDAIAVFAIWLITMQAIFIGMLLWERQDEQSTNGDCVNHTSE